VTPWGADCSGLVQATFALHGVQLPRDAWQQASAGVPADADPLAAREGDLLFFSDRVDQHITHVALALGARSIVHLALGRGGYGIEDLDDTSDRYVGTLLERFACARRVI
jgi:cell wall-associated NlpC family hydrolase